ncbi:hypothetical protein QYE76_022510 [Lolium multiflorum]|uniref:Uncharacterized protein n=1 Tax=Lolium multiflorum TaxID=4521 RepID=A0AAD8RCV8_LOLMU|nr:hypothetical protein QYE76_022510 [Lolium multiflorum]
MSVGSDNPVPSKMTSYYCLNCDTRHELGSSDTPFICSAQYSSGEDSVDSAVKEGTGKTARHQVYAANNTGNARNMGEGEHTPRSSRRRSFGNSASNHGSDYTTAEEEWEAARAAVLNNTPLPVGASVGTLNAFREILDKNRERLSLEQNTLEKRLRAAERSSEQRRGSRGSASRSSQGAGKHRSRLSRLSEDDAREITSNLSRSFMTTDTAGMLRPKTVEAATANLAAYLINAPYYLHAYIDSKDNKKKSSHLLRDCRQFIEMQKLIQQQQQPTPPPPPPQHQVQQAQPHNPNESFPPPRGKMSMIHRTVVSRREMKKLTQEINLAESIMANIPEYIDWSSQSITFSRTDHPMTIPKPGHAALVVEAQIGGFKMSKVFMDGGSGLNLIFLDTIKTMGITMRMLEESFTFRRRRSASAAAAMPRRGSSYRYGGVSSSGYRSVRACPKLSRPFVLARLPARAPRFLRPSYSSRHRLPL